MDCYGSDQCLLQILYLTPWQSLVPALMLGYAFMPELYVRWLCAILKGMCPLWLLGTIKFICVSDNSQ
jgi:hypothetical protein